MFRKICLERGCRGIPQQIDRETYDKLKHFEHLKTLCKTEEFHDFRNKP